MYMCTYIRLFCGLVFSTIFHPDTEYLLGRVLNAHFLEFELLDKNIVSWTKGHTGKQLYASTCIAFVSMNTLWAPLLCYPVKSADETSLPVWRSGSFSFSEWNVTSNVRPVVNIFAQGPELIYLLLTLTKKKKNSMAHFKCVSPFPERNDLLPQIWLKIMGNWKSGLSLWTISHPIKVNLKQINP